MSPVSQDLRQRVLRYALPVLATAIAVVMARLIQPLVYPSVTPAFILAVAVAALYGGTAAGALASLLSVAALSYWFFPPLHEFRIESTADVARAAQFLVVAAVTTWLAGGVRNQRSRAIAEARAAAKALARQSAAENALRQREAELVDFFETALTPMHWVGEDGTILRANQAELDLLGYEREEYVGRHIAEFHVDRPVADDILSRLIRGEAVRERPARLQCKDGQVKDVLINSTAYFHEGRFVHTRCFTRDVTAEKETQDAAARLAAIVSSSNDAIIGKTLDGIITSWNAAAERVFGYTASEMVGQSVFRLIPEDFHAAERDLLARLLRGEPVDVDEAGRIRKDGEQIWISLSVSPVRDRSGAITGVASIKRDITERRKTEAALREQQQQLQLAHEAARMGTWRWDVETDALRWDDGLRHIYGLRTGEQVSGFDDFISRVHPEDREHVSQSVQQALNGTGRLEHEFRILLPDGRVRWLADLGRVTKDRAGKPLNLIGICMDVTDRKAVEEHLRDTQRLQAVGELAGGIAHEANNQMTVVLGGADFLLRRSDLTESARRDVEQIRQAAGRTAAITQQLLAFSRRQLLELQDVDLNAMVQSIGPVLRRSLAENQTLVVRLGLLGGKVRADPRQLEQVLLNLVLNGRDAMPEGGRLTIETSEVELTGSESGSAGPPPGTYDVLVVEDTGQGMDRATAERVFEPFFTTKDVGKGTGLGLSVVHGIVSQIGGHIRVVTAPGRGAAFKLYFPVAPQRDVAEGAAAGEPARPAEGTVALVVEDDAAVRSMAARVLSEAGYAILEAENGRAALDLVRRHTGRLDLVVSDIGMPEMDGYELARYLHQERPGLPMMFMTGYGDAVPSGRTYLNSGQSILQKPFAPDALVRAAAAARTGQQP